jgi:hypothetical protein
VPLWVSGGSDAIRDRMVGDWNVAGGAFHPTAPHGSAHKKLGGRRSSPLPVNRWAVPHTDG